MATRPVPVEGSSTISSGVIDAAVHTLIGRKIVGGPDFDESPVGVRRRRSMAEGLKRIEADLQEPGEGVPTLDAITAVVTLDYVQFRFPQAGWMPSLPRLERLQQRLRARPAIERTLPYG